MLSRSLANDRVFGKPPRKHAKPNDQRIKPIARRFGMLSRRFCTCPILAQSAAKVWHPAYGPYWSTGHDASRHFSLQDTSLLLGRPRKQVVDLCVGRL